MSTFKKIEPKELEDNIFTLIGTDWFLVNAEKDDRVNSMTVAWATAGVLWGEPVMMVAVRPERFTHEFMLEADTFSLSTFDLSYRRMLGYMGTVSGRDEDKIKESELTVLHEGETPYFEEARLNIICEKLAMPQLKEDDFLGNKEFTDKWYGGENKADGTGGGYHYLYIGKITDILVKED